MIKNRSQYFPQFIKLQKNTTGFCRVLLVLKQGWAVFNQDRYVVHHLPPIWILCGPAMTV